MIKYYKAIRLHLKIVWRVWDIVEVAPGQTEKIIIDWNTAWKVSKGIHLK